MKLFTKTLNEEEQKIVEFIAKERIKFDRKVNASSDLNNGNNKKELTQLQREINSYGGEFAFCALWNVYPDLNVRHHAPYDARIGKLTIDIKTTRHQKGHLAVKMGKRYQCDLFGLMVGVFPVYRFCGFMDASRLLVPDRLNSERYDPPMYEAAQGDLCFVGWDFGF